MRHIRILLLIVIQFSLIHLTDSHLIAQPVISGYKNLPAEPPEPDQSAVPWLPFEEDWNTGLFETNQWDTEGNDNGYWRISIRPYNMDLSAEFCSDTSASSYALALTSRLLSARNLADGCIYLSFFLEDSCINPTGHELMKVQVSTDTVWSTVWADSNLISHEYEPCKCDITEKVKGKLFRFRFVAEGQNSLDIRNWRIDNIKVIRDCAPPLNLTAIIEPPYMNTIKLDWQPPFIQTYGDTVWLTWDNHVNIDGVGLNLGGTFTVASRFTPMQLAGSDTASLVKIRFFPFDEGIFELKVWTGTNAAQLVHSQLLENPAIGSWNEIELSAPITVITSAELWFGYTVTHEPGVYPAGVDSGPAVTGYGDLISLDGVTWERLGADYALCWNWSIAGQLVFLQENTYRSLFTTKNDSGKDRSVSGSTPASNLQYYNIFEGIQLIDTTSATEYFLNYQYGADPRYFTVQAVYVDCLSDQSNVAGIFPYAVAESESKLKCYPIPAHEQLSITLESDLSSLSILDFNSIPVFERKNLQKGTLTVNTAEFRNGLYLIRAFDSSGKPYHAKFIIQH